MLGRILLALTLIAIGMPSLAQTTPTAPMYEVYAVQYAVLPQFPVASLVQGADRARRLDIACYVWVIKGGGHVILFDSGFYRDKFLTQWKPTNFAKPSDAVARLGIKPEDVTDVIISHAHWDHADGADLFPKAQVWIQKDEYQYYTGDAWQPVLAFDPQGQRAANARHGGVDPEDMLALVKANFEGRLHFIDGDNQTLKEPIAHGDLSGIRCYTGGKHTYQSQFCSVATRSGIVVLASDNMYLYENLEKHAPIAQTLDAASNLRAQDRMQTVAAKPELIIPGHDPLVMTKFPKAAEGVARID